MNTQIRLIALPPTAWRESRLEALVNDALVSERRIRKGSNVDVERARYGLGCQHIEALALERESGTPELVVHTLNARYLDALAALLSLTERQERASALAVEARLGATFYPPAYLEAHITGFSQLACQAGLAREPSVLSRLDFLRSARFMQEGAEQGFGIVEVQVPFLSPTSASAHSPILVPSPQVPKVRPAEFVPKREPMQRSLSQNLRDEIRTALAHGTGVNLSNPPHSVITEVLHEFVFSREDGIQSEIRVLYNDGSEGEPFPVHCLDPLPPEEVRALLQLPPLRAALISMRHLEMDVEVDVAWFLNQQASRPQSFSETDTFCYEKTLEQLDQFGGMRRLDVYQTGLQPAVVGFYRALVHWLQAQRSKPTRLVVVPQYYHKQGGYVLGQPWC